jgi:hypothetical protein
MTETGWLGTWGRPLSDAEKLEQLQHLITAEIARLGLAGFDVEDGGGGALLVSRAGHVHATWTIRAGRLHYVRAGYGAPSFTTLDATQAAQHTVRELAKTKST